MAQHWKAFQWGIYVVLAAFIFAIFKGWYAVAFGLMVAAGVVGFILSIHVAQFDGRPSYEDEDRDKHGLRKRTS